VFKDGFESLASRRIGGSIGRADGDRNSADAGAVPLSSSATFTTEVAMVENRPAFTIAAHAVLALGVTIMVAPVWLAFCRLDPSRR